MNHVSIQSLFCIYQRKYFTVYAELVSNSREISSMFRLVTAKTSEYLVSSKSSNFIIVVRHIGFAILNFWILYLDSSSQRPPTTDFKGWYRPSTARFCMVSIQRDRSERGRWCSRITEHRIDWTRHRFSTGSIVHESVMQKRFGTGSIVHETVIRERFSTSSIVHRRNCAPVNIKKNYLVKSHFCLTSPCIYNARKLDVYS